MNRLRYRPHYRRNLPHWQPPGATLFIIFRLAGSLPVAFLRALAEERQRLDAAVATIPDRAAQRQAATNGHKRLFGRYDHALDAATHGPRWLGEPRIAELVAAALRYLDERRYDLAAYCVMPNHVHLLCTPLPKSDGSYHALAEITHALKRHTAYEANRALQRSGPFWQHESYDHVVRDANEHERIAHYILNNPVKAGLVQHWEEWAWSYAEPR